MGVCKGRAECRADNAGLPRRPLCACTLPMKPATVFLIVIVAGALNGAAVAQSGRSLGQVRNEMNNGTWEGITLIGKRSKPAQAAASAATVSASAPAAEAGKAAPGAAPSGAAAAAVPKASSPAVAERAVGWLGWGEPLSGQPLNASKRLDAPQGGIPLPTAPAGSSAAAPRPR